MAYSPASIAKGYLDAMNIEPPEEKFTVSNRNLGIAMESFMGGRSETRIRLQEVPVVPVDFTSEYPSICVLLGLWGILTAKNLSFCDATRQVRKLVSAIALDHCFRPQLWPELRFFALVIPQKNILPVRTMYNGSTPNIGNNYLSSSKPIWVAGPDLIASAIQTGSAPKVIRAIRVVANGGFPANVDPERFRLVAPFETDQTNWKHLKCINIGNPRDRHSYGLTSPSHRLCSVREQSLKHSKTFSIVTCSIPKPKASALMGSLVKATRAVSSGVHTSSRGNTAGSARKAIAAGRKAMIWNHSCMYPWSTSNRGSRQRTRVSRAPAND